MSAYCPDELERIEDERQRTLDAEYDAYLLDRAYVAGCHAGMVALAYRLGLWLDAEYDAAGSPAHADWIDRVGAEMDRLVMAGMPDPLPEPVARLLASDY